MSKKHLFWLYRELPELVSKGVLSDEAAERREARDAYVTVRVRNGFAVLEQLHVAGKPIEQFLRERE